MLTYQELFDKLNELNTKVEAAKLFEDYVTEVQQEREIDRVEAENLVRKNIGYIAGYGEDDLRKKVLELYQASHPILPLGCTPSQAFELGLAAAEVYIVTNKIRTEIKINK